MDTSGWISSIKSIDIHINRITPNDIRCHGGASIFPPWYVVSLSIASLPIIGILFNAYGDRG